ncbi:MAG: ATP-dependent RNA helicase HrpA [Coraliomargarita sp.]
MKTQSRAALTPTYTNDLPIHARREEIIRTVRDNQIVVIAGETGSGKTTQLPKFLLECGLGQTGLIGCTQPRRVAALSVAQRIADELKVQFGKEVGAKIRFTDQTSKQTSIKVMTDGILLNEIQEDPLLRAYDVILIDEAHERSLNIDFILGFLRQLSKTRTDLKIIITSATIDTETFSKAFGGAPIIEVSGRMYPVDVLYRPIEAIETETQRKDLTITEASAEVIAEIIQDNREGDILAFLPGERDIHEVRKLLEDSPARSCDILPLFGRLATADQQRIFHPGGRRRIILSTNIAETSLTVPGIRYVVDSGLARVSRYSPHSRTQRLPIEPVAQSSADQRKGRCGRVSNGICYRLYSEDDYKGRPRFTTPEIHRSNLAAVILRMLAFRLGDVRTFPFIEPPSDSAIRGGFRLLSELGAVRSDQNSEKEDAYQLTKLGRRLAHLPVDPTVARMLLEAQRERCVPDVLVIAAGLSIQDPRERPAELAKEADAMQRRFIHKDSDFLTLLNIWNTYHDEMEQLTQRKLRKFCVEHFLSFQRMREWRDIYNQLERILKDLKIIHKDSGSVSENPDKNFAPIHKSILAGLLSNVAIKEADHNYRGPRNRKAMLFPGSGLFDHETAKKQRKASYQNKGKVKPAKTSAPDWIVCGEWMETNRLYARTAAKIDVRWIEEVAGDLIQTKHAEPFWSIKAAAAQCKQRKLLFGLEIARRNVSLTPIAPKDSTDIFVRNGLVEQGIRERPEFLTANALLCQEAESELARRRMGSGLTIEDRLFDFYRGRLNAVGSFAELRRFAKESYGGKLDFLKASLADLLPQANDEDLTEAFPKEVNIGGSNLPLRYRHDPGGEADGVTLQVPINQLGAIQEGLLDWAVPGHLEEKIESLLRGLPKPIRVSLHPLKERSAQISKALEPSDRPLREILSAHLLAEYKIRTNREDWSRTEIPAHLKPRIQVETNKGKVLAVGRSIDALRDEIKDAEQAVSQGDGLDSVPAWQQATAKYEREKLSEWNFGDLPEAIDLSGEAGLPLKAYPALVAEKAQVHLRLMHDIENAQAATQTAWPALGEVVMARDLAWIQRDLKDLKQLGTLLLPIGSVDTLKQAAWQMIRRHLFRCEAMLPLKQARFEQVLQRADQERRGIIPQLIDQLRTLLEARLQIELLLEKKQTNQAISYPGMRSQMEQLAPANLLESYEFSDLPNLTRFLKGMLIRAERAKSNIQGDIEKSKRIVPFENQLNALAKNASAAELKSYRLLLEEFKISVFAQELGTAQKVSEKRLDQLAQTIANH